MSILHILNIFIELLKKNGLGSRSHGLMSSLKEEEKCYIITIFNAMCNGSFKRLT